MILPIGIKYVVCSVYPFFFSFFLNNKFYIFQTDSDLAIVTANEKTKISYSAEFGLFRSIIYSNN